MKAGHWDVPVALQDLAKMWIPNFTLPNNFLQVVEGLWKSFPPLVLGILDSPCLLILFSYTIHKGNKTKSYTDPHILISLKENSSSGNGWVRLKTCE